MYPRTNVAIKEVIKWLNALSEMNNLTPCYYVDPLEPRFDDNGDGKFSAGPDDWLGGTGTLAIMIIKITQILTGP
jgi:hypothetical protein